jgi:hypothetical protein
LETNIEVLYLYTEVFVAYIAFATIVATLRQAFGKLLTPFQYLLFRFFVDSGLIHVVIALLTISLVTVIENELMAWRISTYTIVISVSIYLPSYLIRRRKLNMVMPISSKIVAVGYGCFIPYMIVTASELFWLPSLATTLTYLIWAIMSNILVFVQFLSTFVEVAEE